MENFVSRINCGFLVYMRGHKVRCKLADCAIEYRIRQTRGGFCSCTGNMASYKAVDVFCP
jgi:hypothetical protein